MTTPDPGSGAAPRLVLAVGPLGSTAGSRCRPGDRLRVLGDADEAGAVLDAELPRLVTGWRVLVVGTARDGGVVRAAALTRGALDEEITVLVTGDATDTRVVCGVCDHRFDGRDGERARCPGCGVDLVVTDHGSRIHGAVLGAPRVP